MPAPMLPHPSPNVLQGNIGNVGQALWNVIKFLSTPNKNSQTAQMLGAGAQYAKHPLNLAMIIGGGPEGSPLEGAPWLQPYSLARAMGTGRVAFREGQPHDFMNANSLVKGRGGVLHQNPNDPAVKEALIRQLHDMMFGGTVHAAPGHNIPPRP